MDRWLEQDLALKVIALLLSVFLWLYVSTDQNQQTRKTFDALRPTVQNLPTSMTLADPQGLPAVRVTVEGSALAVGKVRSSDVVATLSLKDAAPGLLPAAVEVTVPPGVRLVDVYPQFISVQVEPRKTARVPVQIKQVGALGDDYEVIGLTPADTTVVVDGPASKVDLVSYVFGPVSLDGVQVERQEPGDFSIDRTVNLGPLDKSGQQVPGVTITPTALPVTVAVRRLPPSTELPVEARVVGQPAPGYRVGEIILSRPTVKLRSSDPEALRAVRTILTQPVDVKGATSDVRKDVTLVMPTGGEVLQPQTISVTVHIVADTIVRTFEGVPVTVRGLGEDLESSVQPASLTLKVEGPRQVLEGLNIGDVKVFVDADGLDSGDYQLQVEMEAPTGVTLQEASSRVLSVTIRRAGGGGGQ